MDDNALDYLIILVSDFLIATVYGVEALYMYIYYALLYTAKVDFIVFMLYPTHV